MTSWSWIRYANHWATKPRNKTKSRNTLAVTVNEHCVFAEKVKDEELEQQKKIDEAINLIGRLISEGKKPSVWAYIAP